jgi:hypothetical protein
MVVLVAAGIVAYAAAVVAFLSIPEGVKCLGKRLKGPSGWTDEHSNPTYQENHGDSRRAQFVQRPPEW